MTPRNEAGHKLANPSGTEDERWQRRPVIGALVRLVALFLPILASLIAAIVASRVIQRPSGFWPTAGWWVLITLISSVVLLTVDRIARRLLPLAALLKLSLVFPDQAPSRYSVAFRAGTTRNLRQQLDYAAERGTKDELSQAAERILTLVSTLNVHDRGTRGHSERVRAFIDLIAEELRLP